MTIQKINKIFIGLIIFVIFANGINILNDFFIVSDYSQNLTQVQLLIESVIGQGNQQVNWVFTFFNNTFEIVRVLLVSVAMLSGLVSVIGLLILKKFTNRIEKYKSIFNYSGLVITAITLIYVQYRLMPTFTGLISLISIVASIAIIGWSTYYIITGAAGIYKIVKDDSFKANEIAIDIGKILSFIFIIYTGLVIGIKISSYVTISIIVKEVDLAAIIDIMNYIDVDWNSIIPPVILASGLLTADKIDLFINSIVDQYVLDNISNLIQNGILSLSRSVIFSNIIAYLSAFIAAAGILFSAKNKFEYHNYVLIALMAVLAIIGFVYIDGVLITILSYGLVICLALFILDYVKKYK